MIQICLYLFLHLIPDLKIIRSLQRLLYEGMNVATVVMMVMPVVQIPVPVVILKMKPGLHGWIILWKTG